ncbi:4Fe-4S dicluster domain-containing protein [Arabiibacter massiliensis]|uniref:4Fe-4S dicluster domain-containing protein n=1 Tax=Arabiibacter massiliensis TaxID=1870985 RepID=UPI0009B9A35E|nr:4Fe-4S dicluster domain-containing protein [Arabiibacter massiliensis]
MAQFGFFFDQAECIGCKACQVACCDRNDLTAGFTLRTVRTFETGVYPDSSLYHFAATCNHCASPACVASCPTGACQKSEDDGTVYRDPEVCIGCGTCATACPYEHPVVLEDRKISAKCDGCKSFRDQGLNPVCVDACVMRAIEWGDVEELAQRHPEAVRDLPILPDAAQTEPSLLVNPHPAAGSEDFEPFIV